MNIITQPEEDRHYIAQIYFKEKHINSSVVEQEFINDYLQRNGIESMLFDRRYVTLNTIR